MSENRLAYLGGFIDLLYIRGCFELVDRAKRYDH